MIRQTGGLALGATSTRSRSSWRAMVSASGSGLIPSCLPSGSTRRTSRARMRSLIRCSLLSGAAAMRHHSLWSGPLTRKGQASESNARPRRSIDPDAPPPLAGRWPGGGRGPASRLRFCKHRVAAMSTLWTPEASDRSAGSRRRPATRRPAARAPAAPGRRRRTGGDAEPSRGGAGGPAGRAAGPAGPHARPRWSSPTTPSACSSWPPSTCRCSRPQLDQARLAIDALGALVEGLGGPAGRRTSAQLSDGLGQLRLAFVQIQRRPRPATAGGRRQRGERPSRRGSTAAGPTLSRPRVERLDAPASQRPSRPASSRKRTGVPDRDRPGAVGDLGAVERVAPPSAGPVRPADRDAEISPSPTASSKASTGPRAGAGPQWTILEIGSSMMSVAPWSFSAGMSVLMSDFGTTVSTA